MYRKWKYYGTGVEARNVPGEKETGPLIRAKISVERTAIDVYLGWKRAMIPSRIPLT